jgi:hypothetical protein
MDADGPDPMSARYVICRADATVCHGRYWAGGGCWTNAARDARTLEFMSDAELRGIAECLFQVQEWNVVPVELPEAPNDDHRLAAALGGRRDGPAPEPDKLV